MSKINLSECVVFGTDGFADAEATAEAVRAAIEQHVTAERETDALVDLAVNAVYDQHPAGTSWGAKDLSLLLVAYAAETGLDIRRVMSGFDGWKDRNVVEYTKATPGSRFVSKKGPGNGITRLK